MFKKLFVFFVILLACVALGAQSNPKQAVTLSTTVDHWETLAEAQAAPAGAPFYYPDPKTSIRKEAGPGQEMRGLPQASYLEMDLPDRMTKDDIGIVKIGADREIIYDTTTGEPLFLAACGNKIYGGVPIPLPRGRDGKDGKDGVDGRNGYDGRDGRDAYYNQYGYQTQYVPFISFGVSWGWGSCAGYGYQSSPDSSHTTVIVKNINKNYNTNNHQPPAGQPPGADTGGEGPGALTGNEGPRNNGNPPGGTTGSDHQRLGPPQTGHQKDSNRRALPSQRGQATRQYSRPPQQQKPAQRYSRPLQQQRSAQRQAPRPSNGGGRRR